VAGPDNDVHKDIDNLPDTDAPDAAEPVEDTDKGEGETSNA
jgi:hypothetical protein